MERKGDKIKNLIIISLFLLFYIFIIFWFFEELFVSIWVLFFIPLLIIPVLYIYILIKSIELLKEKGNSLLNWTPLLTLIFIIIIFIFFNPIDLRNKYEFKKYFGDRNYIINEVKKDKSKFKENSKFKLEEKYKKISRDGEIKIFLNNEKETLIGFKISYGGSYLVYSSSGKKLIKDNIKMISEVEFINKNWYYITLK